MSGPRITLVGEQIVEDQLRAAVPELNGELRRWPGSVEELYVRRQLGDLLEGAPDVIAFGPGLDAESVLEIAADLDRSHPNVEVLVLAEPSPQLWERAARAGIREVVSPSGDPLELAAAVRRTISTIEARRDQRAEGRGGDGHGIGSLVVIRSPKGGSGKTMVASNVAAALAHQHPGEVVVVDLDLQFGDLSTALGVEPQYTIADATATGDLTPAALKALLTTHRSSLYVLCAPPRPDEAGVITGDDVAAVLQLLRAAFRFVVVDTAAGTDERVEAALAAASDVVHVCSMDVSSVRAIRKDLDAIEACGGSSARPHLVLNRADSRVALEVADIEATVGRRVDVHVSSSRLVPLHMNCGEPVVEAEPSSNIAKQLREVVAHLAPAVAERPAGKRTLRWRR